MTLCDCTIARTYTYSHNQKIIVENSFDCFEAACKCYYFLYHTILMLIFNFEWSEFTVQINI